MNTPHPLDCARRLRSEALRRLGPHPALLDLHAIAESIRRHCGHTPLKSFRLAWGWTVAEALTAARVLAHTHRGHYPALTIAERSWKGWEAGERASPIHQDLLCRLFSTSTVQLGFATDYTPRPRIGLGESAAATSAPVVFSPEALGQDTRATIGRVQQIASSAMHPSTLNQLDADVRRLARHYVSQPLSSLYTEIRELRVDAMEMIETNRHPGQARRLHLAAARLCGLQAHICLDLGHYGYADTNARAAWTLAESAGDPNMLGWTRALQSLIAYWDNRYVEAVSAAEDGLVHPVTDSNRVRLHALRARASAATGDRRTVVTAIGAAEDAQPRTAPPGEPVGGVFEFPNAKCHVYAGTALLALDPAAHAAQARAQAERAIGLYTAADPLDRSSGDLLAAHLDLVTAHVASNDLDAAQDKLSVVTAVSEQRRTASIVKRARSIATALRSPSYRDAALARSMREEITEFCQSPGLLPAAG